MQILEVLRLLKSHVRRDGIPLLKLCYAHKPLQATTLTRALLLPRNFLVVLALLHCLGRQFVILPQRVNLPTHLRGNQRGNLLQNPH